MDSRAIYDRLMARAVGRELTGYTEAHHILPQALGGSNKKANIVRLTYREHFLAHWLLVRFTAGDDRRRMGFALHRMGNKTKMATRLEREVARRANVTASRGARHTPEAIIKIKAAMQGKGGTKGNRGNTTNHPKAHQLSAETRARLSEAGRSGRDNRWGHL